jgi:drug/metabolite transporter (DMT)-like permease
METNWASDHLQTIRTLMERSALYRRALAPVMIVSGCIGVAGALVTCFLKIESNRAFSLFWLGVSLLAVAVSFVLVRRQALKDAEPFWSLPTRRVTEALLPAFLVGLSAGIFGILREQPSLPWLLTLAWIIIYGCALHAAGFFMQNRMKLFGWIFIIGGCAVLFASTNWPGLRTPEAAHYLLGGFFGVLHMACGIYLYFTEKQRNAS